MSRFTLPEFSNFQYTADKKTGLSAVYDAAKMRVEEVSFKFPTSKFIVVSEFPIEKKPGEVYVRQNAEKGLEIALKNNEGQINTCCYALDKMELKSDFTLTQESLKIKQSEEKNALTLEKNIAKELFMQGWIGRPFNLKIYKVTPTDPKESPFLLAINHAKSGSQSKDAPPRVRERLDTNYISKILQKEHADCTHFVWGGDSNEPAYLFKDEKKDGKKDVINDTDLEVNTKGLTAESTEIAGSNLIAVNVGLPGLVAKARLEGIRNNEQTDKGGETGNAKLSAKSRIWAFKFADPKVDNTKANADATAEILKRQSVPEGNVTNLQDMKTGSDHKKTKVIHVNGIGLDAQPLLETAGKRKIRSHIGLYKAPYDENSKRIEQASALKLTEVILLAMGKTKAEIDGMNFSAREQLIHPNLKKSPSNPLVDELKEGWKEQQTPPRLYAILKEWIESDEQKAANALLVEGKAQLQTEADIEKIFTNFFEKENRDNRIMDAIFRAEGTSLYGGFMPSPSPTNPRLAQLANYDTIVSDGIDLRIAAGDGPGYHDENEDGLQYKAEMLKVCAHLNSKIATPRRLLNTVLGVVAGAVIGTAATLAIGIALPLVIGLALGSTAVFGLVGLAYTSYQQARAIAKSTVPAAVTDAPASTPAVSEPGKTATPATQPEVPALATNPAPVILSKAPESANDTSTTKAPEPSATPAATAKAS